MDNSVLLEQLKSLLDDEANEINYLTEEMNSDNSETENPEGNYKSGASESAPVGHKWVYVFCVQTHDFLGNLIVKTTKKVFNKSAAAGHVALSFDKSLTKMCSFVVGENFRFENLRVTY